LDFDATIEAATKSKQRKLEQRFALRFVSRTFINNRLKHKKFVFQYQPIENLRRAIKEKL